MQPAILLTSKLETWYQAVVSNLPNLILALTIWTIFFYFSGKSRQLTLKLTQHLDTRNSLNRLIAAVISFIFIFTGTLFALQILGLSSAVASMLAGAGIIGLALGFALQEITANFISGILLTLQAPFKQNDLIKTNDHLGTVYRTDFDSTQLKLLDGQLVDIPNKEILLNPLVNYSTFKTRRITLKSGVAYHSDLDTVRQVATKTIEKLHHDPDKEIEFYFTDFGDSSINFMLRFWIPFTNSQKDYYAAKSQALTSLKAAFDKAGIEIPYPTAVVINQENS